MKRIVASLGLVLALTTCCQAGFLHQSMQGEYKNNGFTYDVANDGRITLSKDSIPERAIYGWYVINTTFNSVEELDKVIADLQHVSQEIHNADNNCKQSCK